MAGWRRRSAVALAGLRQISMARILLAWELGGGLGHLVPWVPVIRRLRQAGHQVSLAVRELTSVDALFGEMGVTYLQAPFKSTRCPEWINPPRSLPHILHNTGFSDPRELKAMGEAWRALYDSVRPDYILFDHSPTALLAARTIEVRRAVIGIPFCCPPDVSPMPDIRAWMPDASEQLRRDEERTLATINAMLAAWHQQPLERLSQLYHQVDAIFTTGFRELDPYQAQRVNFEYYGVWPNPGGIAPVWPDGSAKKVFAYLKPFKALGNLLEVLAQLRHATILYIEGLDPKLKARFESPALRFESRRLDVPAVAAGCDLAILNAGHGATAALLLAGKPLLLIPLHLEQALTAGAVVRFKAGLSADPNQAEGLISKLMTVLQRDDFAVSAREFATRYAGFDPQAKIAQIVERIEALLPA
jgi:hypothetical protein